MELSFLNSTFFYASIGFDLILEKFLFIISDLASEITQILYFKMFLSSSSWNIWYIIKSYKQ